jgi:hypothetical protein
MSKEKVIPFKVDYYDITGNHLSALVLVQLEYWQPKAANGWISKKEDEWKQELRITYKMLQRIQDNLIQLGFIDVKQAMYSGRKTTHYRVNSAAINKAIEALKANPVLTKGKLDERSILPKVNITKGELIDLPKVSSSIDQRSVLYTESTTESTTDILSDAEKKSASPLLFKTPFMNEEVASRSEKNASAAPKNKTNKVVADEVSTEVHKQTQLAYDFFTQWYLAKYATPYISSDRDFVNLKRIFKKLITGTANLEAKDQITPERCFKGVQYIVNNFDKLDKFSRDKLSLNLIATRWSELISQIKNYKEPVERKNFGDPVAYVPTRLPAYYNGYPLPLGITYIQFIELGKLVYREKVMEGLIDEPNYSVYKFYDHYQIELKKITEPQLTQILKDYEII